MTRIRKVVYVPVTPAGTYLFHLESPTEDSAKRKLLKDAAHMPYKGWEGFKQRGYTIHRLVQE
jgi:hypothetical protein